MVVLAAAGGCIRHDLSQANLVTDKPPLRQERPRGKSWFYNTYLYPTARWFIPPAGEAAHLDADGEVPTGSFYVNRDIPSISLAELEFGPGGVPREVPAPITIQSIRDRDDLVRFFGTSADGRRHFFKPDHPDWPELTSGAEVVTSRLLWALGYHVPVNRVCTIEGTGDPRFDGRRAVASEIIPGEILGPWRFRSAYRRREMRGLRVAAAWLNYASAADHNTLVAWRDGAAYFYLLDFDNSLGATARGPKDPWIGWRHAWDVRERLLTAATLGLASLRRRPWEPVSPVVSPAVGRFDDRVDPRRFHCRLPNYAFHEMTEADARWMARKIAQLTPAQIRAAVRAGRYSDPRDEDYLVETLLARRAAISLLYRIENGV